jgi:hypothetical protein
MGIQPQVGKMVKMAKGLQHSIERRWFLEPPPSDDEQKKHVDNAARIQLQIFHSTKT